MEKKRNLLVTLANKDYIIQAKQLFSCVYWNAGWDGDYMLLSHEIPNEDLQWFLNKGIIVKECKPLYNGSLGNENYSDVVIDKFYLFTEEFKAWKHVLFLDSDMIVRAPINRMIKTNSFASPKILSGNFLCYFSKDNKEKLEMLKNEFNINRSSFNSGVFAFNTDIINKDTFNDMLNLFKKYASISNGDDSILNLFFYKIWQKKPLVFNVRVNVLKGFNRKKHKAIILHFQKQKDCPDLWNKKNPFYIEWEMNLKKAEYIDLKNTQSVVNWNMFEIVYFSLIIRLSRFSIVEIAKKVFMILPNVIDATIGKTGIFIKRNNPKLYFKVKTWINGKKQ